MGCWRPLLLALLIAGWAYAPGDALTWRLFAGREECVSEYMPQSQWEAIQGHLIPGQEARGTVDIGVVISSRHGTEENKAAVDWVLYDPAGNAIHKEDAITSTEITAPGVGGQGPWKACFKVSRRHLLRPSVMVEITHFTVNSPSLVGTHFEWQRPAPKGSVPLDLSTVKPGELGTTDQVEGLAEGLQRLDYYIHNVTNEQRYLSRRADRHMQTVRSTHARTLWYYIALYLTIVAASFAQVVGVRLMFRSRRQQGLII